jgi:hypothetical protein
MQYSVVHWINNEDKEQDISEITGTHMDFCGAITLCRKITDDGLAIASEIRMEDEEATAVCFYDGEDFVIHSGFSIENLYSKEKVDMLIEGNEKIIELHNYDTSFTVGFNHNDTWIHNPLYSDCLRFEVDPIEYYGADFLNSPFVKSKWVEPFIDVCFKDFTDKLTPETKYAVGVNSEIIELYRHTSEFLTKYGWDERDVLVSIHCITDENIDLKELSSYLSKDDLIKVASGYYEYCMLNDSQVSKVII